MKRTLLLALWALLAACTQNTGSVSANLIGTHDLLFVDQIGDSNAVAKLEADADGNTTVVGLPGRFLFLTSADTNELRVLELFRPNFTTRDFMRGPNPLETLSIPVLDRPTLLATDEGRNSLGQRVSSQTIYAARPGGAEVSIVSLKARRQLGGRPVPAPGPVLAIGASMTVTNDTLPAATTLYVATWDGAVSSVFTASVSTDPAIVDAQVREGTLDFTRLTSLDGVPLSAMYVVSPLSTRTLDGAAFCATEPCLALASRLGKAGGGEEWLLEPSTGRSVKLAFPAGVRKFAAGASTRRLYALLDESKCGGPQCGGVVAVDLLAATSSGGFPESKNVVGSPFGPLRVTEGLITGLAIAQGGVVRQIAEVSDGGSTGLISSFQRYDELGAFTSSDGLVTWFSGAAGSLIDYDGRRSTITAAALRTPGVLDDGGITFAQADGGIAGSFFAASVSAPTVVEETWRRATVTTPIEPIVQWGVEVSDGYFTSQDISVINRGLLPGLVNVSAAASTRLPTSGLEVRAQLDDVVIFQKLNADSAFVECGRAAVVSIGSGTIDVDAVPPACADATSFSVRAAGTKPLVVVAATQGYLGRTAPGEQFTYNQPYVLIPADVIADRTSLTITVPTNPFPLEGAYISFTLSSFITPLRVQIDTSSGNVSRCASVLPSQVVFGNLVMLQAPTSANGQTDVLFPWTTFAVVPSGNAVAEFLHTGLQAGGLPLTSGQGVACHR